MSDRDRLLTAADALGDAQCQMSEMLDSDAVPDSTFDYDSLADAEERARDALMGLLYEVGQTNLTRTREVFIPTPDGGVGWGRPAEVLADWTRPIARPLTFDEAVQEVRAMEGREIRVALAVNHPAGADLAVLYGTLDAAYSHGDSEYVFGLTEEDGSPGSSFRFEEDRSYECWAQHGGIVFASDQGVGCEVRLSDA